MLRLTFANGSSCTYVPPATQPDGTTAPAHLDMTAGATLVLR